MATEPNMTDYKDFRIEVIREGAAYTARLMPLTRSSVGSKVSVGAQIEVGSYDTEAAAFSAARAAVETGALF